jgi:hypothetical protein
MHDVLVVLRMLEPKTAERGGSYDKYSDVGVKVCAWVRRDVEREG